MLGSSSRSSLRSRKRRYNLRRIRATWPYTVQEIAELFGIHKNAVLRWLKEGLHADRGQRPFLIRGDELTRFLDERQNGKRQRCGFTQFYCFRCRAPRGAWSGIVDVVIESPTQLRIEALCAECDRAVSKVQSVRVLPKIRESFAVQQLAGEHLIERANPGLNSDFGGAT